MANVFIGNENQQQSFRDRAKEYKFENDRLNDEFRKADFQKAVKEEIRKKEKKGKSSKLEDDDSLTGFYKNEINELVSNVSSMTKEELKTQNARMKHMMSNLEASSVEDKAFLREQLDKSQKFIEAEYDKKNKKWTKTKDAMDSALEKYVDIQSLAFGLVDNNPLASVALKMGFDWRKKRKEQKKNETKAVEQDDHRQQMAIRYEEEKAKDLEHDREVAKKSEKLEAKSDNDSGGLSAPKQSVADEINESQGIKAERQTEQNYYTTTLQWQKDVMKMLKTGAGMGIGGAGIAGGGAGGDSGLGMAEVALASGAGGGILAMMKEKAKKLIPKKLSSKIVAGLGITALVSSMFGGDAEASPVGSDIEQTVAEDQQKALLTDAGLTTIAPTLAKTIGRGASRFVPGVGAIGDAGMEYAEGGSVGSAMTAGAGALAGAGTGASIGATAGLAFGPGAAIMSPVLGFAGGVLGGIGGAMASTELFGDSDEEKQHNLISRNLQDKGYINRDDLLPFDDSELLKPGKLQDLSVQELQALLAIDDFSEDDTKLIQDNLLIKMGKKEKLSKESEKILNKKSKQLKAESSNDSIFWSIAKALPMVGMGVSAYDAYSNSGGEKGDGTSTPSSGGEKGDGTSTPSSGGEVKRNNSVSFKGGEREIVDSMLHKIGQAESNGDYDAEYGSGAYGDRGEKLTDMTFAEVKAYQKEMLRTQKNQGKGAGQRSSAIGKYQFISNSLKEAQEMGGFSDDDMFTAENQDKLGEMWLRKRGGLDKFMKSGKTGEDANKLQNKVAGQWASMKNTSGVGTYDNDGMNTARHSIRGEINALATSESKMTSEIASKKSQIDSKESNPVIVDNSTHSSGGGGGGQIVQSDPSVGNARNSESTAQRLTDRYISQGAV